MVRDTKLVLVMAGVMVVFIGVLTMVSLVRLLSRYTTSHTRSDDEKKKNLQPDGQCINSLLLTMV